MPTSSSPSPAELAEDLQAYLPPLHGLARVDRDGAALGASARPDPIFSWAVRLRDPDVEAVRA